MQAAPAIPAIYSWSMVAYPIAVAILAIVQWWIAAKVKEVHTLVNGQKGTLLEALAVALEDNAELSKTPQAYKAAALARKAVQEHKVILDQMVAKL